MKNLPWIIVVGLLASAVRLSAQPAHEYWFTGAAADNSILYLVDADSITRSKTGISRAWLDSYAASTAKKLPGGHSIELWEFNCRMRQARPVQVTAYNSHDEQVPESSEDKPEAWSYVVPNSIGEANFGFTCADSAFHRKAFAINKLVGISPKAWAKRTFEQDANSVAWALLTPEQKLNLYAPNWREICASKEFADWFNAQPASVKARVQRNGDQIVDALDAVAILQDFQKSQQSTENTAKTHEHHKRAGGYRYALTFG